MDSRRSSIYLIIVVSLLAGMITGRDFFFTVAYAFIGLVVFSFLWAWSGVRWLHLRRQTRARRAQVGHFLDELFTVKNTGLLPKLWLEIYDHSDLPGHTASQVVSNLGPRQETSWRAHTLCVRRGAYRLGPLRVVTGDPFGLFQAERRLSATSPLVVYPPTVDIPEFTLPIGILPGGDAVRRRTQQVTTNAAGIRDYAPGDSFSRIHWPTSARKNRLFVKEFELDPLADVWLLMDAERTVHVGSYDSTDPAVLQLLQATPHGIPPTTEEYTIAATASLARYFLQRDRAVGLISHARQREFIHPERGGRQLTKILETLAIIEARGVLTFEQLMSIYANQLPRGATVVLVTPSTRDGWVTAAHAYTQRGLRIAAVLIDGQSFGGRPGTEENALRLAHLNIPTYIVRRSDDLRVALSQPRV